MVGRVISHYRVLEKLGAGGMGVVYKAQDLDLNRFAALKFLHDYEAEDGRERFIQEALEASALDHPNICTIYERGKSDDGRVFLTLIRIPRRPWNKTPSRVAIGTWLGFMPRFRIDRKKLRMDREKRSGGSYPLVLPRSLSQGHGPSLGYNKPHRERRAWLPAREVEPVSARPRTATPPES